MNTNLKDLNGRIIGPYELIERKGEPSAQGIVYLGENIYTRRHGAVKILTGLNEWERQRREVEAETHCSLNHPNIVSVQYFGYDQPHDVFLLATEFVEGVSLTKILETRRAPLSLEETVHVLTTMAGALSHTHSRSIVHLDVKPSNILAACGQQESVLDKKIYLIDFGFGVWATQGSAGKRPAYGTSRYSAPEQVKNEELTEKTDIYQLGLVTFEMLTGHVPFFDPDQDKMRTKILHDPVPLVTSLNASLEIPIDSFFQKVLAKEPRNRFSTGEEMFDEFMKCVPAGLRRSRSQIPRGPELPGLNWVKSSDGIELAFTKRGSNHPLILLPPWVSHQGLLWADDWVRKFLDALAEGSQLILYDKRGCGLCRPREVKECGIPAQVEDLDALVRYFNLDQVALLGMSAGGPVAIKYAAHFPEKVSKLILYGTYACGRNILTLEQKEAQIALVKAYWGREECAGFFLELFGGHFAMLEDIRRYLLASSSREHAAEFLRQIYEVDSTEDARKVRCPALILHRFSDRAIPYKMAEELRQLIPGSKLEPVPGSSHLPWVGIWEKASRPVVDLILGFLKNDIH